MILNCKFPRYDSSCFTQIDVKKRYRPCGYEQNPGPWDPLTASIGITAGFAGNVFVGLGNLTWGLATRKGRKTGTVSTGESSSVATEPTGAPVAQEIPANAHANTAVGPLSPEKRSVQGLRSLGTSMIKMPGEVLVSLSQGLHNAPRLYGDTTVRPPHKVTGFRSGMKAAGKEFGLGVYDGFSGVVTQPISGARDGGGKSGAAIGFAKGLGGLFFKPLAGTGGLLGYPLKGVQKEIQKKIPKGATKHIRQVRMEEGYTQLRSLGRSEMESIIEKWHELLKSSSTSVQTAGCPIQKRRVSQNQRK